MRTGCSYMGHHNPRHMAADCRQLGQLGCDDVFLAAQENDFVWMTGKVDFFPRVAREHGLRPIAIFWGALNLFGGGRQSHFLLDHPEGHQVNRQGGYSCEGCYVNPACVGRIREMIDRIAAAGFEGYFIDEPTHLQCYCDSCRRRFHEWYGGDLAAAPEREVFDFRSRCVVDYVSTIAGYVKAQYPHIETMTCLMECDKVMWEPTAAVKGLDNLGSDIYWVNSDRDVEEMTPLLREMAALCKKHGKVHHEWLQCWIVKKGREQRIIEQGKILVREKPDAPYVWAYLGQLGTVEACEDPDLAWQRACEVLRMAKEG